LLYYCTKQTAQLRNYMRYNFNYLPKMQINYQCW